MAFQSVNDTVMVEIIFSINTVIMENTFYFLRDGGYDLSSIQSLTTVMKDWCENVWMDNIASDSTFVEVRTTGLENQFDLQYSLTSTTIGAILSDSLPANVSLAVSRRTGLTGRATRGRIYVCGIPRTKLTTNDNFLDAAWVTAVTTSLNLVRQLAGGAGWLEVLVSRFANGQKRPTGITLPITEYVAVDARVDSQRGRLPKP